MQTSFACAQAFESFVGWLETRDACRVERHSVTHKFPAESVAAAGDLAAHELPAESVAAEKSSAAHELPAESAAAAKSSATHKLLAESAVVADNTQAFTLDYETPVLATVHLPEAAFAQALHVLFDVCLDHGVSLALRQHRPFERNFVLLDERGHSLGLRFCSYPTNHANGLPPRFFWWLRTLVHWPAPRTTAVVGPDGSGKTALIDALRETSVGRRYSCKRFKRYFRRVLFHVRKNQDRNELEDGMLWLILPLAWIYFSVSRWTIGWFEPILLDRYFYDYFVRDVRHPERPLRRIGLYEFCSVLAPRPGQLVIVSCPAKIIHARSGEMSVPAIEALYSVYLDQVLRGPIREVFFCHTGISQQASAGQLAAFLHGSS